VLEFPSHLESQYFNNKSSKTNKYSQNSFSGRKIPVNRVSVERKDTSEFGVNKPDMKIINIKRQAMSARAP
jgi:hypothetical protein